MATIPAACGTNQSASSLTINLRDTYYLKAILYRQGMNCLEMESALQKDNR